MSTNALKTVVTGQVDKPAAPKDFPAMLNAWLPEIKRALPKHLNADRMSRIALTAFRRTPKLGECDPRSVFAAVVQASQLGLEPDTLGRAYLIPYKVNKKVGNRWESHYECQFVPGWKGLVDLMNRSGQGTVWTGAVFEGDDFDYQLGDAPYVRHRPGEDEGGRLLYTYAVGRVKGAEWPIIEVWPIAKVWKHRDRYNKVGERHYSYENEEMYARKVPLLQVLKYMPCSAELSTAIALNDDAEIGRQKIDLRDAIEGTYVPVENEDDDADVDRETGEIKDAKQAAAAVQQGDGPTFEDAIRYAKAGDFDMARDIASSLGDESLAKINQMIANRETAEKGDGKRAK